MKSNIIFKGKVDSSVPVLIAVSTNGVEGVEFGSDVKKFTGKLPDADWKVKPFSNEIKSWLFTYKKGTHTKFPYRLKPRGTEFQKQVWKAMQEIPFGETRTYKWIAEKIGRPNAVRAVGNACGANPIPLVIPCHRVVAQNGLGGFSGGLHIKKKLLTMEKF